MSRINTSTHVIMKYTVETLTYILETRYDVTCILKEG